MTNKNRYPRMRNGNVEGGGLPPHYWGEKNKQVVFHIRRIPNNDGNSHMDEKISL